MSPAFLSVVKYLADLQPPSQLLVNRVRQPYHRHPALLALPSSNSSSRFGRPSSPRHGRANRRRRRPAGQARRHGKHRPRYSSTSYGAGDGLEQRGAVPRVGRHWRRGEGRRRELTSSLLAGPTLTASAARETSSILEMLVLSTSKAMSRSCLEQTISSSRSRSLTLHVL